MKKAHVKIYKARAGNQKGLWRWHIVADNGKIVAESGEGYVKKADAIKGLGIAAIIATQYFLNL